MAAAIVVPEAVVPSEKTAVTVSVVPGTNSMFAKSAAKRRKEPPSATAKLTATVAGSFRSTPSSVPATPRSQELVAASVSQEPGALLRSCRRVMVRPPLADNVTVKVPSRAPSAPSPKLPAWTRSRSLPS